jgi:hypothetical protein
MDRRLLITALACCPVAGLLAQGDERPRYKVSAAQLHEALSARFPVRFGVPGLLELQVSAPELLMLPTRNKLGASLRAEASGPGVQRVQQGMLDLVFALRYEGRDRSIRAYEPEVIDIRLPGVPAESLQALRMILPGIVHEIVAELVLHTFTSRELALPQTMGFEPETVTVVEDGVVVIFRQKPRL